MNQNNICHYDGCKQLHKKKGGVIFCKTHLVSGLLTDIVKEKGISELIIDIAANIDLQEYTCLYCGESIESYLDTIECNCCKEPGCNKCHIKDNEYYYCEDGECKECDDCDEQKDVKCIKCKSLICNDCGIIECDNCNTILCNHCRTYEFFDGMNLNTCSKECYIAIKNKYS